MDFEENNGKKKNCNTVWICSIIRITFIFVFISTILIDQAITEK